MEHLLVRSLSMVLQQFQATYGKPLLAARDPKCSAKDAEGGILAMEALHKQVFVLIVTLLSTETIYQHSDEVFLLRIRNPSCLVGCFSIIGHAFPFAPYKSRSLI